MNTRTILCLLILSATGCAPTRYLTDMAEVDRAVSGFRGVIHLKSGADIQACDIHVRGDSTFFVDPSRGDAKRILTREVGSIDVRDRIGGALEGLMWGMLSGGVATRTPFASNVNESDLGIALGSAAGLLIGALWELDWKVVLLTPSPATPAP